MHLITEDPMKNIKPKGAPNTGRGGGGRSAHGEALKRKIVDKVSDVMVAPVRAYHGAKSAYHKARYDHVVGNRNYKNRKDDSNKHRGIGYWSKNKN